MALTPLTLNLERHRGVNDQTNDLKRIEKGNESSRKHYQEKFGVDYYTQTSEFKEKARKTKQKKYNNPNFANLEKARKTWLKKYPQNAYFNIDVVGRFNRITVVTLTISIVFRAFWALASLKRPFL